MHEPHNLVRTSLFYTSPLCRISGYLGLQGGGTRSPTNREPRFGNDRALGELQPEFRPPPVPPTPLDYAQQSLSKATVREQVTLRHRKKEPCPKVGSECNFWCAAEATNSVDNQRKMTVGFLYRAGAETLILVTGSLYPSAHAP